MRQLPIYLEPARLALEGVGAGIDPYCTRCALHEGVRTVCMAAEVAGPETGDALLVLGAGAAVEEDRVGRPHVGPSGMYLRNLLMKLWAGPIVYDNIVRCAPGSKKVTPAMLEACRPFGSEVLNQTRPVRILAFGNPAIAGVVGKAMDSVSVRRGYAYSSEGVPAFLLMHPTGALRNRFVRGWLEDDVAWALSAAPERRPDNGVALVLQTVDEVAEACEDLRMAEYVTWDVETFGLPHNPEQVILHAAFTPAGAAYAYVVGRELLDDPSARAHLQRLLEDPRVKQVGQNLKFDIVHMRAKYGIRARVDFDLKLARRLLAAHVEAKLETMQALVGMAGGKDEAGDYVDSGVRELRKSVREQAKQQKLFPELPPEWTVAPSEYAVAVSRVAADGDPKTYAYAAIPQDVCYRYNSTDTISTDRLVSVFRAALAERPDLGSVWEKIGRGMAHAVAEMEHNGIAVSLPVIRDLQKMCGDKIVEISARLAPYGEVNYGSQDQVAELLFGSLGLKPLAKTGTGKPSVAAEVLEKMSHPVAADILALRRATKFKTQYADGMESFIRGDGRIHPSFNIAGTSTGRPSCQGPNLLNIPRAKSADGKLCRDIFIAPPGFKLVELDQSQIELRVAAMLSRDPKMIALFQDPSTDFHLSTAKFVAPIFGIDPAVVDKEHELRDRSKTINFGIWYGKEAAGFAAELGITTKAAQKLIDAVLGQFSVAQAWIKEQIREGQRTGLCRTWWDGKPFRERSLWRIADHDDDERKTAERSTVNTPVQGTAADFTNASLGAIQQWLEEDAVPARLVLTVYDSVILEVADSAVDEVVHTGQRLMTQWNSLDVPLVAEAKVGQSWGSLVKYGG